MAPQRRLRTLNLYLSKIAGRKRRTDILTGNHDDLSLPNLLKGYFNDAGWLIRVYFFTIRMADNARRRAYNAAIEPKLKHMSPALVKSRDA